jgi:hypothetical protein
MVRENDGMKGIVGQDGPELRIIYLDRGEERLALKSEKWLPDELKPGPLRSEEKLLIALHADRALRAYERSEPLKSWERVCSSADPYDEGLVQAILQYLAQRPTRAAISG